MTDPEALLQAIIDAPEYDARRLVFADWQVEHGQPEHAELIGVQCVVARLKPRDAGRRKALKARGRERLALPARGGILHSGTRYGRGSRPWPPGRLSRRQASSGPASTRP